jgi:hypothetical protein
MMFLKSGIIYTDPPVICKGFFTAGINNFIRRLVKKIKEMSGSRNGWVLMLHGGFVEDQ